MAQISGLLQAVPDLYDSGGKQELLINGIGYQFASFGTRLCLTFFLLMQARTSNCIVLWDEPESGLHPTRRTGVLEVMLESDLQFVLASHATEFAPIFEAQVRVFGCRSTHDETQGKISLRLDPVDNRKAAFAVLESLGALPSRALFTADVVIWVEGPTELAFFRHWLTPRLRPKGYFEGFHYTFMHYGGALISYMEVDDESHAHSTFDLLSMCRHPLVIVDSDLRQPPSNPNDPSLLKKGARRIYDDVEALNTEKPGSAEFIWTRGREIENFLPEVAILHAV